MMIDEGGVAPWSQHGHSTATAWPEHGLLESLLRCLSGSFKNGLAWILNTSMTGAQHRAIP